jgi:hypothetical protein
MPDEFVCDVEFYVCSGSGIGDEFTLRVLEIAWEAVYYAVLVLKRRSKRTNR